MTHSLKLELDSTDKEITVEEGSIRYYTVESKRTNFSTYLLLCVCVDAATHV